MLEGWEVKIISWVQVRRRETVEGKKGLEGNKEWENHYRWAFIFSGEDRLVVEGKYKFFCDRGSVFFRNGPG